MVIRQLRPAHRFVPTRGETHVDLEVNERLPVEDQDRSAPRRRTAFDLLPLKLISNTDSDALHN